MKLRAHEQSPGDSAVHIVMELCEGSELFDRIVARGLYTERAACIRMTLEAVQAFGRGEVLTDLNVKANDLRESIYPSRTDKKFELLMSIIFDAQSCTIADVVSFSESFLSEFCQAFLNYINGNIKNEEFLTHWLELLRAPDKYDICDLKEACHESLLQDIETPQLKTSTGIWKTKHERINDLIGM